MSVSGLASSSAVSPVDYLSKGSVVRKLSPGSIEPDEAVAERVEHTFMSIDFATQKVPAGYLELSKKYGYRNRYSNIYASDRTLPKLPPNGYFNANLLLNGQLIVGQAPLNQQHPRNEMKEFVQMLKLNDIRTIVTLVTPAYLKCEKYWAEQGNVLVVSGKNQAGDSDDEDDEPKQSESANIDSLTIQTMTEFRDTEKNFSTRELKMQLMGEDSINVRQYHYDAWPDRGVISPELLRSFFLEVQNYHEQFPNTDGSQPKIYVHCSAGIGRSGTFALVWEVMSMLKNAKEQGIQKEIFQENTSLSDVLCEIVKELPQGASVTGQTPLEQVMNHVLIQLRNPEMGRVGLVQSPDQYLLAFQTLHQLIYWA
jgi:protein tyrosine phosphatase